MVDGKSIGIGVNLKGIDDVEKDSQRYQNSIEQMAESTENFSEQSSNTEENIEDMANEAEDANESMMNLNDSLAFVRNRLGGLGTVLSGGLGSITSSILGGVSGGILGGSAAGFLSKFSRLGAVAGQALIGALGGYLTAHLAETIDEKVNEAVPQLNLQPAGDSKIVPMSEFIGKSKKGMSLTEFGGAISNIVSGKSSIRDEFNVSNLPGFGKKRPKPISQTQQELRNFEKMAAGSTTKLGSGINPTKSVKNNEKNVRIGSVNIQGVEQLEADKMSRNQAEDIGQKLGKVIGDEINLR